MESTINCRSAISVVGCRAKHTRNGAEQNQKHRPEIENPPRGVRTRGGLYRTQGWRPALLSMVMSIVTVSPPKIKSKNAFVRIDAICLRVLCLNTSRSSNMRNVAALAARHTHPCLPNGITFGQVIELIERHGRAAWGLGLARRDALLRMMRSTTVSDWSDPARDPVC